MKPNLNFWNQYDCLVKEENREKAVKFLKKLQDEKPDLYKSAIITIRQTGTDMAIKIDNMSAFDESTRKIVLRWFNSINSFC
jgi:hypothetical protein